MHRIDGPGATVDGLFTEGNPAQGMPATTVTGAWLNGVQEEIANAIEGAGLDLDKQDNAQLLDAIRHLVSIGQGLTTGDIKLTIKTVADAGWLMCNDGTIGKAGSAATARAGDDCQALFLLLWNSVPDGFAPVAGGRGASAAADWAAGKTIQLTRMMGRALAVAGAGAGLSSRSLGQYLGGEQHTLTVGEMPGHAHGVTDPTHAHSVHDPGHAHGVYDPGHAHGYDRVSTANGQGSAVGTANNHGSGTTAASGTGIGIYAAATGISIYGSATGISVQSSGGGGAHNNMQPTAFLHAMIKL